MTEQTAVTDQADKYRAPALERGLDVVELLSIRDEPMSKKEIADALGRSVNELFRMLVVLERRNYIALEKGTGKYRLTLKMFELSNKHPPIERLLSAGRPELAKLAELTQQSCHIAVYHDGAMLIVAKQESPYKMGFSIRQAARIDVHGSGSGLAMLAFKTPEQRNAILAATTATPEQARSALSQMDTIRRQGFFFGASPQVSGITNISYPVFNSEGEVEAVLTMPFLTLNSDSLHHQVVSFEDSRNAVARSAANLMAAIGGRPPEPSSET
ncbi:IclR family transcriptional regulator [Tropicimonas aquimaris]|uniref:IclR family transcriptional regulator n=1 Tax=Tropicimonas aquimaris TaxID=914152 RepID=A0ABW3IM28_9RHOB